MSKSYLFDVNALIGLLWDVHSLHGRAHAWYAKEKPLILGCAFTELSFIRVSMADKTIAASFDEAELALRQLTKSLGKRYRFLTEMPPPSVLQGGNISTHKEVSDHYLCAVARTHRARLATMDAGIKHPTAFLIR